MNMNKNKQALRFAFDNEKLTENGDKSFKKLSLDELANLLFMSAYYEKNLSEVSIGDSEREKIFAMFMRDPRFGMGRRDLGRLLGVQANLTPEEVVLSGRFDDLWFNPNKERLAFLKTELDSGNHLAKKWMPRSRNQYKEAAYLMRKYWKIGNKEYNALIKTDTTESRLTEREDIDFEKVPSLAMLKYMTAFHRNYPVKFADYLESVKKGESKMNFSTATPYDIYRLCASQGDTKDLDILFDQLPKISISCVPVIDSSASMFDSADSFGKAASIGHYLSKCSSFAPDMSVVFSSEPYLIDFNNESQRPKRHSWYQGQNISKGESRYAKEVASLETGEISSTDLGKTMELFSGMDTLPEYLVILTDMEFDAGSSRSKERTVKMWRDKGYTTKIVWWNFNSRSTTAPETDSSGNIFLSGYSPVLLKYLESGFNNSDFIDNLLVEYEKNIKI